MAMTRYLKIEFPIKCLGRDNEGKECLKKPVEVKVKVFQSPGDEKNISSEVKCVHITGGHGQRCKASYPEGVDKVGEGINCPYSFDLPYALDKRIGK